MSEEVMYTTDHGFDKFVIKAFIISLMNHHQSQVSTRNLLKSIEITKSLVQPFIIPATTPETIDIDIKSNFAEEYFQYLYKDHRRGYRTDLNYTWPKTPVEDGIDFSTGIYKRAYGAADWRKVAACTISHMRLWQHCIDIDEPILILEHDAYFVERFYYRKIALCGKKDIQKEKKNYIDSKGEWTGGICGINSPFGATRKASTFDFKLKTSINLHDNIKGGLEIVPYVDDPGDLPLPSGLPGNSAYIIKPWAAKKLLDKVLEVGIWPNDALMCRQFFPWLQHYYPYFTKVQGTPSTTTK
jgi:GR25 family glycosyltransferase involved in LPS biosynthesis